MKPQSYAATTLEAVKKSLATWRSLSFKAKPDAVGWIAIQLKVTRHRAASMIAAVEREG